MLLDLNIFNKPPVGFRGRFALDCVALTSEGIEITDGHYFIRHPYPSEYKLTEVLEIEGVDVTCPPPNGPFLIGPEGVKALYDLRVSKKNQSKLSPMYKYAQAELVGDVLKVAVKDVDEIKILELTSAKGSWPSDSVLQETYKNLAGYEDASKASIVSVNLDKLEELVKYLRKTCPNDPVTQHCPTTIYSQGSKEGTKSTVFATHNGTMAMLIPDTYISENVKYPLDRPAVRLKSIQSPLKAEYYAPNAADCFYADDHDFRRWLRTNVNTLMKGWSEELYERTGFIDFCREAQYQFLKHISNVAYSIGDEDFIDSLTTFLEDESVSRLHYEDPDNSSIEWGDPSGTYKAYPHLVFNMYSEFYQPEDDSTWFTLCFNSGENTSDEISTWFGPERDHTTSYSKKRYGFQSMKEISARMLQDIKEAVKELDFFWHDYIEEMGPLSPQPEEWRM